MCLYFLAQYKSVPDGLTDRPHSTLQCITSRGIKAKSITYALSSTITASEIELENRADNVAVAKTTKQTPVPMATVTSRLQCDQRRLCFSVVGLFDQ